MTSPLPTPQHLDWSEQEIGVIIHFDLPVFEPSYEFRLTPEYHPDPAIFAPSQLDTDQWVEAAASAGAKYAVLVAKHCSGFCLWPTAAHPYSVKSSPWKGGQGDLVADFIASCRRFGLRPGLYYSSSVNAYLGVDNPGRPLSGDAAEQQRYNQIVLQQLGELWGKYGPLFEIWFDGGVLTPAEGGPDIPALLQRLQPDALVFQGPRSARSLLRWSGNELGQAPEPCWNAARFGENPYEGLKEIVLAGPGDPQGEVWAPAEADLPLRDSRLAFQGGWFWHAGEDHLLLSPETLLETYEASVGRSANLLLGLVVDERGRVPEADCAVLARFGELLRQRYAAPLAKTSGEGSQMRLRLDQSQALSRVVIMEDLRQGERIRAYRLLGKSAAGWTELARGQSVGHKRILPLPPAELFEELALFIDDSTASPQIRSLEAYR